VKYIVNIFHYLNQDKNNLIHKLRHMLFLVDMELMMKCHK